MANDASELHSVPSAPDPKAAEPAGTKAEPTLTAAEPNLVKTEAADPGAKKPAKRRSVPRWEVVQTFLDMFDEPRYVEVGVSTGGTFHQVSAASKVAVDPRFRFDWETERRRRGPATQYHQVTSDVYFGSIAGVDQQFDVIFLDGLHTFEQTLRDLTNALAHLAPRGVIVIDDVNPPTYHASLPNPGNYRRLREHVGDQRRAWMGDVYKLVWFIDTFYQTLSYATVADNHGEAVVWRERRTSVVERGADEIAGLSFESFVLSPDVLQLRPFAQILRDVADQVGSASQPQPELHRQFST